MNTRVGIDEVYRNTGVIKVPAVKTAKGDWLADSTAIIEWFERKYPHFSVTPVDPATLFIAKLVEDYADEWCWRSAMYFRWRDPDNARYMSKQIARQVLGEWPIPRSLAALYFKYRQRSTFLCGDGLTKETEPAIRQQFFTVGVGRSERVSERVARSARGRWCQSLVQREGYWPWRADDARNQQYLRVWLYANK